MFGGIRTNKKGYPSYKIGDLYNVRSSKRIYAKELVSEGIPFLKVADVLERIETGKSSPKTFISDDTYRKLSSEGLVPRAGDIILTSRGTIGKCYIITEDDHFYFQDGMISWLKPKENCRLLPAFMTAMFEDKEFLSLLDEATNKTTVTYISLDKLAELKVICPSMDEQEKYLELVEQSDKSKYICNVTRRFLC